MKRVNDNFIDERYFREVFIPSHRDQSSDPVFSNVVVQFEEHLAEFRIFMHQVELGKIPVTENIKNGWQSNRDTKDYWIFAGYYGRLGLIADFQKHKNQAPYPLIYGFRFSTNGYLLWADTIKGGFKFDEHGRIQGNW